MIAKYWIVCINILNFESNCKSELKMYFKYEKMHIEASRILPALFFIYFICIIFHPNANCINYVSSDVDQHFKLNLYELCPINFGSEWSEPTNTQCIFLSFYKVFPTSFYKNRKIRWILLFIKRNRWQLMHWTCKGDRQNVRWTWICSQKRCNSWMNVNQIHSFCCCVWGWYTYFPHA